MGYNGLNQAQRQAARRTSKGDKMQVNLIVDFKGVPTIEDFAAILKGRDATQVGNGMRLGHLVQRWETSVRLGEIGEFVENASHHPQVIRVQQKGFECKIEDL
jgi:hypothetical protein